MSNINQGYGGRVITAEESLLVPSVGIADDGSLLLARCDPAKWYELGIDPAPIVWTADAGVTVDGSNYVTGWLDRGRGAYNATQVAGYETTVSYLPTGWSDGTPAIQFNSGQLNVNLGLAAHAMGGWARSFVFLFRPTAVTASYSGLLSYWGSSQVQNFSTYSSTIQLQASSTASGEIATTRDVLAIATLGNAANASSIFVNGNQYDFAPNNMISLNAISGVRLGGRYNGSGVLSYASLMLLKQFGWLNARISGDEYRKLTTRILGREFCNFLQVGSHICNSSLLQGGIETALGAAQGKASGSRAGASNTNTTLDCIAAIPAGEVVSTRKHARNFVVFAEGSNDLAANHPCSTLEDTRNSAATIVANIWRYCQEVKRQVADAGKQVEVILLPLLNRSTFTANQLQCVALVNATLAANWQTYAEAFVPLHNVESLMLSYGNTTWYSDGVSPSAYGQDIITNMTLSEILRRLVSRRVRP